METVKADSRKRIRIPDIKPGQVFAVDKQGEGSYTLTIVKAERKEPFPKGSLRKFVDEMNREWAGVKPIVPEPEEME